ncbi:MAG: putative transposase, partial [Bacteroidota bacterium]
DADILPDKEKGVLRVIIHNMANPLHNRYVMKLCQILNESETVFPGTYFRMFYDSVANQFHGDPGF